LSGVDISPLLLARAYIMTVGFCPVNSPWDVDC